MTKLASWIFLTVMLLVGSAIAEEASSEFKPLSPQQLNKYQYCGNDSDCVAIINGCCDCSQGGSFVAINKERKADFASNFDCMKAKCSEPDRSICKQGVVSCVEHKCRYF